MGFEEIISLPIIFGWLAITFGYGYIATRRRVEWKAFEWFVVGEGLD
ncbi:hypothetical protein [Staphylothermus hellenicus]|uniref:Uncharacterized protein n=1 Tax=Staphylothermus hellenicus (strain DSM 12710 / JCM 10830 / BK20S6-10-b1 / P8) TaxID=591019 RepID=D7DAQ2_STAHD|nr:hypothetical protein [Staphylothermus hellenicus]ADI31249.1 hypothetical protein Shell_0102 [Staphylothermus hellenicus DSM 12710]